MDSCPVTALARALIRLPSVTPDDAGCQPMLIARLQAIGFTVESLTFGNVCNFWAWHGKGAPSLVFAGHTDVVPGGPLSDWQYPPFAAQLDSGRLYGRGAADMKGALAAMVVAAERFVAAYPQHLGRLAFLITADEEGPAIYGTAKVVEVLEQRGERIDYCLVGEPSSSEQLGDVVRNGRRGSLTGRLTLHGISGHVAYPHLVSNPIHKALPFLQALLATEWDGGTTLFPPTTLQIVDLQAEGASSNVVPHSLQIGCNWRYSPALTACAIKQRVIALLTHYSLDHTVSWQLSGQPFFTAGGALLDAVVAAVQRHTGLTPQLSTAGGTSDGRFIAKIASQTAELGLVNATIHKTDEWVSVADLRQLSLIYQQIMSTLLLR